MYKPDDELVISYIDESREQLAEMESDLLALDKADAAFDEKRVNSIFRAIHSVKGGAEIFNFEAIAELAHSTENVLGLIRSRKLALTPARIRILLRAVDGLNQSLLEPCSANRAGNADLLAELGALYNSSRAAVIRSNSVYPAPRPDGNLRVLLVEDDFACRLLLQTFLARYGECHVAVNGKEAVAAFRAALDQERPYNLICMDIMMPEMDGREAMRLIRALEEERGIRSTYGAKVFMTTTVDEVKEVFLCFKELCDAYLVKPIDLGQLLSQMEFYKLLK